MEMLTLPLSIIAFAITLWITSFFARLLSAKKADMVWIFIAWLLGVIISVGVVVSLGFVILDKRILVILTYLTPLIVFTIVYRLFNHMNWLAAITTNITAFAVGIIATVIVIITTGKPLDETIIGMAYEIGLVEKIKPIESLATVDNIEAYEEETLLTDHDLLAPKVRAALEKQKKRQLKSYIEPKFQVISIRRASGVIGYKVRLAKQNGKVLEGILNNVSSGQLIIKQNLHGGVATTPITMRSVKKLEVYR